MRKEVKLGIIACIIIAATFLAVDFLKGKDLFTNDIKLHTSYSSVEGLSVSTPVTIQGYKVGNITEMSYDPQQRIYNISFTVLSEFDIPNDSYLEVYSSDILGSKALRIILGSSAEYFTSGESIKGEIASDLIGKLTSELSSTKSQVDTLLTNLNKTVNSVNVILNKENTENIASVMEDLQRTMSDIAKISATIKNKTPEIESLITNFESVSNTIAASSESISKTLENAEQITSAITEAQISESINSLKNLLDGLQNESGTIGKLLTSDSLYNSITSLSSHLDSLVTKIEKDPKKYIKISIF
ncbi:MAG: MCE family protein [Bacteroidales bacterium]|nr:MCE family protein [Bacteroidales bacterium]MBR4975386.1 MCE family protein [Bacteroidales bacterium]